MTASALTLEIAVEAEGWPDPDRLEADARAAISAAMAATGIDEPVSVSLLFADDAVIRVLNRDWRGKDKATNVLSFPAPDTGFPEGPEPMGDIALALETVTREANDEGKPFADHLAHLLVHGFLHLAGYDHETDEEAEEMEALERSILATLAIPDPYAI